MIDALHSQAHQRLQAWMNAHDRKIRSLIEKTGAGYLAGISGAGYRRGVQSENTMDFEILGTEPRFAGTCPVCNEAVTPSRLSLAVLAKGPDGKYRPIHEKCARGRWKNRIGGGRKWDGPGSVTVTVDAPAPVVPAVPAPIAREPAPAPAKARSAEIGVSRRSQGRHDHYDKGAVMHFPRIAGGGGADGHWFTVVTVHPRWKDDDTDEWMIGADVRAATPAESATLEAAYVEAQRKKDAPRQATAEIQTYIEDLKARGWNREDAPGAYKYDQRVLVLDGREGKFGYGQRLETATVAGEPVVIVTSTSMDDFRTTVWSPPGSAVADTARQEAVKFAIDRVLELGYDPATADRSPHIRAVMEDPNASAAVREARAVGIRLHAAREADKAFIASINETGIASPADVTRIKAVLAWDRYGDAVKGDSPVGKWASGVGIRKADFPGRHGVSDLFAEITLAALGSHNTWALSPSGAGGVYGKNPDGPMRHYGWKYWDRLDEIETIASQRGTLTTVRPHTAPIRAALIEQAEKDGAVLKPAEARAILERGPMHPLDRYKLARFAAGSGMEKLPKKVQAVLSEQLHG